MEAEIISDLYDSGCQMENVQSALLYTEANMFTNELELLATRMKTNSVNNKRTEWYPYLH